MKLPYVVGVVGESGVGKTTFILNLLPKFVNDGFNVAVVKHCMHGFDLDVEGKDSWRFVQKGATGVLLTADDKIAIIRKPVDDILYVIQNWFTGYDFVLVEGYHQLHGIKKINLLRKDISERILVKGDELLCLVTDFDINTEYAWFKFEDMDRIYRFIIEHATKPRIGVRLSVNNRNIELNPFVSTLIRNVVKGMVKSLKLPDRDIASINISLYDVNDVKG